MKSNLYILAGVLVWVALGFITFVCLASIGYMVAVTFMVFSPWAIIGGTVVGMAMTMFILINKLLGEEDATE